MNPARSTNRPENVSGPGNRVSDPRARPRDPALCYQAELTLGSDCLQLTEPGPQPDRPVPVVELALLGPLGLANHPGVLLSAPGVALPFRERAQAPLSFAF